MGESGTITSLGVRLFDVFGREIAMSRNGIPDSRSRSLHFDVSSLANGIYFYTITANGVVQSRKIVVKR